MTNFIFMNKNKFLTMASALVAVACNTAIETPVQYGELSVSLAGEPQVEVISKADAASEGVSNYTVRIFNESDVKKYESVYNAFETQVLPLGTYYVTAESCSAEAAEEGYGKMRLYGRSADMTLTASALSQTAEVECTVANALVTVRFDESVSGRFSDLKVVVSGGTTQNRTFTVNETAPDVDTEIWFNPSNMTYSISGIFDPEGMNKVINLPEKAIALAAKNNVVLRVSVNLDNGQLLVPTITVNTEMDEPVEDTGGTINPYE